MARYYPQIDVCQSEKDGDIAAKKKELELAAEEDFGNTRVTIFLFSPPVYWSSDSTFFSSLDSGVLGRGTPLNTHGPASKTKLFKPAN